MRVHERVRVPVAVHMRLPARVCVFVCVWGVVGVGVGVGVGVRACACACPCACMRLLVGEPTRP